VAEPAPPGPRGRSRLAGVAAALLGLRGRITGVATFVVAAVLVVTAVLSVQAQRRALTDSIDDRIRQRADDIAAALDRDSPEDALAVRGGEEALAQLVDAEGVVVAATANLAGEPPVAPSPRPGERPGIRTVDGLPIDADDEFRILSRRISTDDGAYVLHVARAADDLEESIDALARNLRVAFPAVLIVVAGIVWIVVGRALRPVEAIRAEVERISGRDLDRRVPEPATRDEIGRLAQTMNAMLDRVEESHRRQQRFVADASHELRSPLTSIRSELEVDLAHPERADLAATHVSVLEEALRLQRLIDDLLYLARADAGADKARTSGPEGGVGYPGAERGSHGEARALPVDLDAIVLREADALRPRGRVEVDTSAVSGAQVEGDADQLTRVVRNLLDNAERHARATVEVALRDDADGVVFTVSDDGPGVPVEDAGRIFERFARVDDARARDEGGAGLGLAIAREIVTRHGGTIRLATVAPAGAALEVRLPGVGVV